jgi:hypothetical protein
MAVILEATVHRLSFPQICPISLLPIFYSSSTESEATLGHALINKVSMTFSRHTVRVVPACMVD